MRAWSAWIHGVPFIMTRFAIQMTNELIHMSLSQIHVDGYTMACGALNASSSLRISAVVHTYDFRTDAAGLTGRMHWHVLRRFVLMTFRVFVLIMEQVDLRQPFFQMGWTTLTLNRQIKSSIHILSF